MNIENIVKVCYNYKDGGIYEQKNINNSNKILPPNKMFSKISILISKGVEILGWMLLILITLETLIIMINEFANILGDLKSLFLELKAMVIASKNGYEIYGNEKY